MRRDVLLVIGVGGMGAAIARRLGPGRTVLLADRDDDALHTVAAALADAGHHVETHAVDVSSADSVTALAEAATGLGDLTHIAHTAGLSPAQADTAAILAVDLLGVALVLDAFGETVAPGGAGVVVASMAGRLFPALPAEQAHALAHTPADELLRLPFLRPPELTDPGHAYGVAKQANMIRVQAAAAAWGRRGARINSLSPGIISTPMGQQELSAANGEGVRAMIEASATGRAGTPDDIAAAAAYLLGPESAFVTGTDLLVDGGVTASVLAGSG
ncbi:SDR family oxidoreductase [Mycobacterium sp. CPCC 205372]|uniref:SDR family oxidoreductase n=1 Tax=Mycobacterium hippophais TaxID=3016340 RepID=A0ABT4PY47_9MYCO|nr:SDR family oxidoreductase [Mycobacterium hippophais]MCZ8381477.1 SDR family oxidoreductase [Mycobacterium hippophais]